MLKNHNIFILGSACCAMLLTACESEAPKVELTVTADKTEVAVGEPVTLTIDQNVQGLCIFSGDEGHNYYKSASYILQNATEEELKTKYFRESDPKVKPMNYSFEDAKAGDNVIGKGMVEVLNVNTGDNLMGTNGEIVNDATTGGKSLRFTSIQPDWWCEGLRINLNTNLGANQMLTLKMRFDHTEMQDIYSGAVAPDMLDFCAVVRIGGKAKGSDQIVFSDNTVWDIYWKPSLESTDYSVDLARVVEEWQGGTGLELETIAYVQILFTSTGSVGYVGDFFIEKITYGSYDFTPFDTGDGISIISGPGKITYTHAFDAPGKYEMVVLGTNTSWKNYDKDGYNTDFPNRVSASEYNYATEMKSVIITVR